jgi:hypothetical protein
VVFWGSGEILVECRHRRGDVHGRRHSFLKGVGCTLPHAPPHTGGNPRISPGSSVVVVASLLEGAAWYAELDVLRAWWNSPKGAAIADHYRFRRPDVLTLLSFLVPFLLLCFFLIFFWARLCCGPNIVSCDCYINIAGRKPVSSYAAGVVLWSRDVGAEARGGVLWRQTVLAEAMTCWDDLPPLVASPLSAPSLTGCTRCPRTTPGDQPSTKAKISSHFRSASFPPIKGRSNSTDGAALFRPSRGLPAADHAGARWDNRRCSDGVDALARPRMTSR